MREYQAKPNSEIDIVQTRRTKAEAPSRAYVSPQWAHGALSKSASINRRRRVSTLGSARKQSALLQIQRSYGNRYVQRLLHIARREDAESNVAPKVEHAIEQSRNGGQALDSNVRRQIEPAFGADFSGVRVHTDSEADTLNRALNASAFTTGKDIFFRQGEYKPDSSGGKELLAHELTHVIQQEKGVRRSVIQRRPGCSATQDSTINADHARARGMLSTAIATVSSYNGTTPAKVFNALSTHFHGATSNAFATWINVNLRFLWGVTWIAGYECYTGGLFERVWACGPNDLATTFWCVPGVDIRLCPSYFGQSANERSTTLIHEWVHKYGCNFDLGYEHEPDYPQNWTVTQLLNADSFSSFIRDVQ